MEKVQVGALCEEQESVFYSVEVGLLQVLDEVGVDSFDEGFHERLLRIAEQVCCASVDSSLRSQGADAG